MAEMRRGFMGYTRVHMKCPIGPCRMDSKGWTASCAKAVGSMNCWMGKGVRGGSGGRISWASRCVGSGGLGKTRYQRQTGRWRSVEWAPTSQIHSLFLPNNHRRECVYPPSTARLSWRPADWKVTQCPSWSAPIWRPCVRVSWGWGSCTPGSLR